MVVAARAAAGHEQLNLQRRCSVRPQLLVVVVGLAEAGARVLPVETGLLGQIGSADG